MTMSMVMTNPEIRAAHRYNVEEKKLKKMKSIMKLCGKVARMLVASGKEQFIIRTNQGIPTSSIKPNDPHQLKYSQDDKKHGVSGDVKQKGSDPFR
jgi:hypothetical protein